MLTINFLITGVSLWLLVFINNSYLQPALKNRKRFRLYRLRDRLSIVAMRGELDEDSEEYLTLLALINSSIKATESFKVTDFLKFVFYMHNDEALHEKIKRIKSNLDKTDHHEYCRIASDYFSVMHEILRSDTRVLRFVFFPTMLFMAAIFAVLRFSKKPRSMVENKKLLIEQIDNEFDGYQSEFGSMCTA